MEWKHSRSPARESLESNHPQETYAYSFLGLKRPSTRTLLGEGHNNKQCLLDWDACWQAEACNLTQTPRTTVVARQCLSTYCHLHCWNLQETQVWCNGSFSMQSQSCPFWLSLVWSSQRAIKRPSFHLGPRYEGSGACVVAAQSKTFFSEGIRKLVQWWTKCIVKQ
jgi:hypothetical protein